MPDRLGNLLNNVAEEELFGFEMDDPTAESAGDSAQVAFVRQRGVRRRHPLGIAAAFVVLAVAAVGAWVASDSGNDVIETPVQPKEEESAPAIVAAAIERTRATSWVAEMEADEDGYALTATITYQPPGTDSGREFSAVRVELVAPGAGAEKSVSVLPSDGSPLATACGAQMSAPCEEGKWFTDGIERSVLARMSNAPEILDPEHRWVGLRLIDSDSASQPDGDPNSFDVLLDMGPQPDGSVCGSDGCPATVSVVDGFIVSLELSYEYPGPSRAVWKYRSFGDAPAVDVPAPGDIVEVGPAADWCRLVLTVQSGADKQELERLIREYVAAGGSLDHGMAAMTGAVGGLSGYSAYDDRCVPGELVIEFNEPGSVGPPGGPEVPTTTTELEAPG